MPNELDTGFSLIAASWFTNGDLLTGSITWKSDVTLERSKAFTRSAAFKADVTAVQADSFEADIAPTFDFGQLSALASACAILERLASKIDKSTLVDIVTARDAWERVVNATVEQLTRDKNFTSYRSGGDTVIEGPPQAKMNNPSVTFSSDRRNDTLKTEESEALLSKFRGKNSIGLGQVLAPGLKILEDYAKDYSV